MKQQIVLIGGGGHCQSCIDVIEMENKLKIAGIVDVKEKVGTKVLGYSVFATDRDLPNLIKEYSYFFITIGQIKDPTRRVNLFKTLQEQKVKLPSIISPLAHVSRHASIGEGTIIMHQAFINAASRVGKNCIINTKAMVEHESQIGDHCHISTAAIVNGQCHIGEGTFIGSNAVIGNNVDIPAGTIISAGATVLESLKEKGTYKGQPAVKVK
jgi:sugar O-acyltransferase (sialic acid O-acetyltransferase NeuD family)